MERQIGLSSRRLAKTLIASTEANKGKGMRTDTRTTIVLVANLSLHTLIIPASRVWKLVFRLPLPLPLRHHHRRCRRRRRLRRSRSLGSSAVVV